MSFAGELYQGLHGPGIRRHRRLGRPPQARPHGSGRTGRPGRLLGTAPQLTTGGGIRAAPRQVAARGSLSPRRHQGRLIATRCFSSIFGDFRRQGSQRLGGLPVKVRWCAQESFTGAAWRDFPAAKYDLVIVDSRDSAAEGVGERDSEKPSRALALLLDTARQQNGPAILVLGWPSCQRSSASAKSRSPSSWKLTCPRSHGCSTT
jgi:hypothetical protein